MAAGPAPVLPAMADDDGDAEAEARQAAHKLEEKKLLIEHRRMCVNKHGFMVCCVCKVSKKNTTPTKNKKKRLTPSATKRMISTLV